LVGIEGEGEKSSKNTTGLFRLVSSWKPVGMGNTDNGPPECNSKALFVIVRIEMQRTEVGALPIPIVA